MREPVTQIASQHLNSDVQNQVQQAIDSQKVVNAVSQGNMDQARQMLSKLQSDQERINVLLQIVGPLVLKGETKLAQQLLEEARPGLAKWANFDPSLSPIIPQLTAQNFDAFVNRIGAQKEAHEYESDLQPMAHAASGFPGQSFYRDV